MTARVPSISINFRLRRLSAGSRLKIWPPAGDNMDTVTAEQRHKNMSHIRSTNTKPEEIVRKYLFSQGFRYRKNDKRYPGKPDIVLPKYKTVIFVNGCFWHHHEGCKYAAVPKSNQEYWLPKLKRNIDRDIEIHKKLTDDGWNIIIVWECEIKNKSRREERLRSLAEEIKAKEI